ncbi:MAG: winged helix-turn-helix transcriptional regulator, partial [Clostridia bacterium]|nr:winged helix-turn-helix transcriptional regulator [Clostridia bacterium]
MVEILELLDKNSQLSPKDIATMLGIDEETVRSEIDAYEKSGVIVGKKVMINWQKTSREFVTAMIEVKVTPQFGKGFDQIAER